ncbi:hypothetical protein [Mucilaginibacter sp.]|uniref:hypothetical protein n=1 Tax=Mucilaginibacter sp. TaxID=1882438 RepID=UPI0026052C16|nr:hypothetical protein [Mucilaginibacter sp.]MDB4925724.1 hypothetical protein [Mucilaginibacter sp.]
MNQQVDNIEYEFLWKLLANPADNNHSHIFNLQSLVNDYPHSGILHALLMPNGEKRNLKHAAAYFNPGILYKLATAPNSLPVVTDEQIVQSDVYFTVPVTEPFAEYAREEEAVAVERTTPEARAEAMPADNTFAEWKPTPAFTPHDEQYNTFAEYETINNAYRENVTENYPEQENAVANQPEIVNDAPAPLTTELSAGEKIVEASVEEENSLAKEYNDYQAKNNIESTEPVYSFNDNVEYFHQDIDDEIYDEIVSIEDIGLEQLAILNKEAGERAKNEPVTEETPKNSFFVFEPALTEKINTKEVDYNQTVLAETTRQGGTNSDISRYNDEKMPYTFMWWLDKTRKDHAGIYQPYTSNTTPAAPKKRGVVDELQQQYYENIVSISSMNELDQAPSKTIANPGRKEDKIIERFIQEEPQIKHPSGIKLDNENKAKKSSEDKDELVTETLARIYTEQMLYHKAILTYKKLMLKFPEKSLYFASQIEQLESKIN